jgi:hypothetical protein
MENDLISIYTENYLTNRGNVIGEQSDTTKPHQNAQDNQVVLEAFKKKKNFKKKKSMKSKKGEPDPGEIYGDSFKRSENVFDKILREMDEMGGMGAATSTDDNIFDADGSAGDSFEDGGDEQSFTLSELREMTLSELADLLSGDGDDDDDYDFDGDIDENDEVPGESYGFSGGEGNEKGDQGTYDGKAKKQPATNFVKGNGDADFSKTKTGYDPEDTEGSEGEEKGDQGTYDGKAKKQPATNLVKGNGDADFGKNKASAKTSSGKKDKNYF